MKMPVALAAAAVALLLGAMVFWVGALAALERSHQYQTVLYLTGAIMSLLIGYALWAMRTVNRRLEQRVAERTAELADSERQFRTLATVARIGIFQCDPTGAVIYTNPHWQGITGLTLAQSLGFGSMHAMHPDDAPAVMAGWRQMSTRADDGGQALFNEFRFVRPNGEARNVHGWIVAIRGDDHSILGYVGTIEDVTERLRMTAELHQAQKLESVGRLAAGVAHEINTPVQFVNDSCSFIRDGLREMLHFIARYREIVDGLGSQQLSAAQAVAELRRAEVAVDLDYLFDNMPGAAARALEGLARVTAIVRSMNLFAHPDQREMVEADLNQSILSTLTIARNEYKNVAELHTDLAELPPVRCYPGELNQAVLNIVVNASHAIGDVVRNSDAKGLITVRTRQEGGDALISVEDTGTGIADNIRDKIFDPFFTTKEVGKGTGQGLAMVRAVIVDKHRGAVTVDSTVGRGSTFTLRIPISQTAPRQARPV